MLLGIFIKSNNYPIKIKQKIDIKTQTHYWIDSYRISLTSIDKCFVKKKKISCQVKGGEGWCFSSHNKIGVGISVVNGYG